MISFLLNDQVINTDLPPGTILLDFIRYNRQLTGTKIGCREGDCGACTILSGSLTAQGLIYRSMTSCLVPLANINGQHIVTVEGINTKEKLSAVQRAISDEAATQCGFCTPGIVMSLTGYCLHKASPKSNAGDSANAIASVDGNICRCTGYKSIERAAGQITQLMNTRNGEVGLQFLVRNQVVPPYFADIEKHLKALSIGQETHVGIEDQRNVFLGGGTDLYVQKPGDMEKTAGNYLAVRNDLKEVRCTANQCHIGGSATVTSLLESPEFMKHFINAGIIKKLISSTPIRNMATISGNFVNASPIGDLTILFLALNAVLKLSNGYTTREIPLRSFYKGYKKIDKAADEFISEINFAFPGAGAGFNFEKVSKRTHLDIASVNSAILLDVNEEGKVTDIALSAGGVGPIPLYLAKTCVFLRNKIISTQVLHQAVGIATTEISPISDARGSAAYKTLLLQQLIKSHFIQLLPGLPAKELLLNTLH